MKENSEKNQNRSNLFYNLEGKRWKKRESPLSYDEFIMNLRNDSSLYSYDDNNFNYDLSYEYYNIYLEVWKNNKEFPVYKKSRGSLFFKFERSNASLSFYLGRCYEKNYAIYFLNKRQNTVSIESFLNRYGLEEGNKKYQEYVSKWKNSISKHDKKDLYKNWKNSPETYLNKLNPSTGINFTLTEAEEKIKNDLSKGFKKVWREYREGLREKSFVNTTLDYYLNRGLSYEDAKMELKKRQATFSLEKCIERYGNDKGVEIFNRRTKKWLEKLDSKTEEEKKNISLKKLRNLPRYSKESKDFFDHVISKLNPKILYIFQNDLYYGSNEMILWDRTLSRPYFYDFSIPKIKLIIEYNGSTFHPNPYLLNEEKWKEWICPFSKQKADDKHNSDQTKINFAKSLGYDVLIVWDTEEYETKAKKCIEFIENKIKTK